MKDQSLLSRLVAEFEASIVRSAELSPDDVYRYRLERCWRPEPRKTVLFVMLNPSTADATKDDATVRKCVGFARRWDVDRLVVANLFAFRATDPRELLRVTDPVGPDNDAAIGAAARDAGLIVCAWGAHESVKRSPERVRDVLRRILVERAAETPVCALQLTGAGHPWHPLYVPYEVQLVPFPPARSA